MKTVLIIGNAPVPAPLRHLLERGSTSFSEQRAADLKGAAPIDADRVVFWSTAAEPDIRQLAEQYAKAEAVEHRESLVFITADPSSGALPTGLSPNELYVWPRDEDRLEMAFLTGA
jgi:hypothetical protein